MLCNMGLTCVGQKDFKAFFYPTHTKKTIFFGGIVLPPVFLFLCLEDFSGTAWRNEIKLSMCIYDHHPLILQRDEDKGHKVKKTDFW